MKSKVKKPRRPKDFPVVEVDWIDAHGGAVSWEKDYTHISNYPDRVRTVGYLVDESKNGLLICLSMTHRGHVDAYIFIPKGAIVKMREYDFKKK